MIFPAKGKQFLRLGQKIPMLKVLFAQLQHGGAAGQYLLYSVNKRLAVKPGTVCHCIKQHVPAFDFQNKSS